MGRRAPRLVTVLLVVGLVAGPVAAGCGDDGEGGDADTFCERLDRLTSNDPFRAFGDTASAADIEVAFEALVERSAELLEVAPPEAQGAARTYAEATAALQRLLAEAGFEGSRVDARAYREEQITYGEAAGRLERYLTAEC